MIPHARRRLPYMIDEETTYVLVPGAASDHWYWHAVVPRLVERGCHVVTPHLPTDDESAGLSEYVQAIEAAIGDRGRLILVAQSMGALSASVVCGHRQVERLVLVAPMIPRPGETGGDWWANTGHEEARRAAAEREGLDPDGPFDPLVVFLHDVPPEVAAESAHHVREQSSRPFADPWPLATWPDVETRVVAGRFDRFFPLEFVQATSRERLGIEPDVIDSGHLPALACPADLVALIESYRTG